ncbi:MAG TPA: copper chaperone PCu(A)C [Gammaproteobacteria bacterium]|nr:copper chaperone PCu(A)C [Gammaproteobacteria bacterium]
MLRKLSMLLTMSFALLPCTSQADGPAVAASHVLIREAPPGVNVMASYLTLENLSGQTLTLVNINSPDFKSVVIHHGVLHDDTDKTQPVANLSIPAHKNYVFAPDNDYLMLTKPVKPLFDGDLVTLTLTFSDHSSLTIMAPVRRDQPRN